MKRIIAGLAVAAMSTLVTAAPAQAAPVNPVKALQKQLKPGHGVRVSETNRTFTDGKESRSGKTTGVLEFGKSGVVASDLTTRVKIPKGASAEMAEMLRGISNSRAISVGGDTYMQGGLFSEELPEGKKWVRYEGVQTAGTEQVIDVFDAKLLKALVAKAKVVKGDYAGSLTAKELGKLTGARITGNVGKIKISYLLDVDSKGLIKRVVSDYTLDFGLLGKTRAVTESRYTGWGGKVKVVAPPESQWVDLHDLGKDTELPSELPGKGLHSLDQR
ncbi:hypothetical protein [Nonomuraea sp. NPDC003214]